MALPPASFNQFAKGSMQAVRLVENSVVWIPYGWVTMMVNCRGQMDIPQALVIPYLNAKLALGYPSLGLLVNFHLEHVKANNGVGHQFWTDHGDSYVEWLGALNPPEDSQVPQLAIPIQDIQEVPPGPPALCDGQPDDVDMDQQATPAGAEPPSPTS